MKRIWTVFITLLHYPWRITWQQLQRSVSQLVKHQNHQSHISSELSPFCLFSKLPSVDTASYSLKTMYTPPVTDLIISRALLTLNKKPNSQWHLAAVCASVSHFSSSSASETLITTMAPVWVTFWGVGLLLGYPLSLPLEQVIIAVFLPCPSHFYGLWADWTDSPLLKEASRPSALLLPWSLRSVLPLNPTPLPQHNTQAITWPQHAGGITHLMCLRCNHNQVTPSRFLSFSLFQFLLKKYVSTSAIFTFSIFCPTPLKAWSAAISM